MTTTERPAGAVDIRRAAGAPPVLQAPQVADTAAAVDWLTEQRTAIRAELLASGCLLIRGLPITSTEAFGAARDVLLPQRASYKEKATPRSDFGQGVFSSTDLPAIQPIRLHNENSYTLDFPGVLMFGCLVAPEHGGATTVGDMRKALAMLPAELRAKFEEKGWLLVRNFSEMAGLPWQTSFATEDKAVAEQYCDEHLIGYEWLDEESLRTTQLRSAIVTHPVTGERSWFNHAAFWNKWTLDTDIREVLEETYGPDGLPFGTYLGDGTPLTEAEADALNAVYDTVTMRETWQVGDVMLVDNILCAHGREAFQGDRKIVVGMGDPVAVDDCAPATQPAARPFGE